APATGLPITSVRVGVGDSSMQSKPIRGENMRQTIDKSHDSAQAQTTPHPDLTPRQDDAPPSQIDHAGPMQQTIDGTDPSTANHMIRWMTLLAVVAIVVALAITTVLPLGVLLAVPAILLVLFVGGFMMGLSR